MLTSNKSGTMNYWSRIFIVVILIIMGIGVALAQEMEPPFVGDRQFMRIGRLWTAVDPDPGEANYTAFAWPGGQIIYYGREEDPKRGWGSITKKLGAATSVTDWTDPKGGFHEYWTCENFRFGGEYPEETDWVGDAFVGNSPCELWQYMRFPPPQVYIDGKPTIFVANEDWTLQTNGIIDENLVTDKAILNRWIWSMGIETERWLYAWTTPEEQDIIFMNFKHKNTGQVSYTDWKRGQVSLPGQTIHNFKWSQILQTQVNIIGKALYGDDDVGEVIYPWSHIDRPFSLLYDGDGDRVATPDWGDPNIFEGQDKLGWRLLSPEYFIAGVIHADKAHDDTSDDYSQPSDVHYAGEKVDCFLCLNGDGTHKTNHDIIWRGRSLSVDEGGIVHDRNDPELQKGSSRLTMYVGGGPYEMPFESDINVAFAWVMGGLSLDETRKMGADIYNQGNPRDQSQEEIEYIRTGKDSALVSLDRAYWVYHGVYPDGSNPKPAEYNQPYNVPDPPRPPANFWVDSKGDAIELRWSNEAEITPDWDTGVIDFAGYRIYRAMGSRDSTYRLIADIPNSASSYLDKDITVGISYYYYMTAYDDGSQNWEQPGKVLESGRFYNWTGWYEIPVVPRNPGIKSANELENIRVVPNPHSVSGKIYPGISENEQNKINFMNLPGKCKIKIYTTGGSLIHTIEHTDGTRIESWNLRTEYNQYLASDLYVYVVESDLGKHIGKFVIIR